MPTRSSCLADARLRFQRDKVRKDVDRLQDLYEKFVAALPEAYALRELEVSVGYDWVSPVYDTDGVRMYNWETQWRPCLTTCVRPILSRV